MDKKLFNLIILGIFLMVLPYFVNASTYLDVYVTGIVKPDQNITISGQIANDTASDTISGINVSATMSSDFGSAITGSDGTFNFNLTAPSTIGEHTVTVETNQSTAKSKVIPVYVSNVTSGSISYIGKSPPFSTDTSFTINLTLLEDGSALSGYTPNVSIYKLNGPPVTWTINNNSASTNANGFITYTVNIPSDADTGQYVIVVEKGIVTRVFSIKSGYILLANTETTSGETSSNFAPGTEVMILAKVKTSSGVATSATDSVIAYITLPNETVRNITLLARDQTTYPGYYNNSFSDTSLTGEYDIRIVTSVGSSSIQGYTFFETRTFDVNLETQEDFFMEWGGTNAFAASGTVGLNIVPFNLTDDSLMVVPTHVPACNSSYLAFEDIFFVNGTSINSTINDGTFTTGRYMMNQICRVKFTGPSESGIYGIKINVTIGGVTETAKGYFSMQKYFLKPAVVLDLGGEFEFEKMVAPGENTTISLSAYNITADTDVDGSSIQNVEVTKITPLEFGNTEITSDINYTFSSGSEPRLTLEVPSSIIGPASVDIKATIGGETVVGNAFFIANYLMGEVWPGSGMSMGGDEGGGAGEGEGDDMGGPPFSSCSGLQTFSGTISEVKTGQAVSSGSVIINGIVEATEEMTGKDISDCVSLSDSGTSGSEGSISVNITFSDSCSLSGFYFMILNATYEGKASGIPAPFMCKNLNFWPEIYSIGGDDSTWRIAPSSGVTISIANITRLNDSENIGNGTVSIPFAFNFNPGSGERMLRPTSSFSNYLQGLTLNYTNDTEQVIQNNITFDIYPQNFTVGGTTLTKWPNGFVDLEPMICAEDLSSSGTYPWTDGCDSGFAGFQVVAFDAWIQDFPWGQTMSVNSSQSFVVQAKTNVSRITMGDELGSVYYSGSNNTAFTVKIGRPWEGSMTDAENVTATLIYDGWNSTENWDTEKWRLNFTIPATIKKGQTMIMITVNNTDGEKTSTDVFTSLTKYTLVIPYEEGIPYWWDFADGLHGQDEWNISIAGWNMTAVNETLNIWSRSGTVCNKTGLTVRRWVQDQSYDITYNSSVKMLIVDNSTSGYDTIIFNNSGELSYVNVNNRTLSQNAFGHAGLYFREIEDCYYAKIVNATATTSGEIETYGNLPTWAGEAAVNSVLSIPYIVKLGDNPVPGAEVHVNGIAKQGLDGFGFEEKLTEGVNYTYTKGQTDALGLAFLQVNVTNSGRYNLFWKVNLSASDYDKATFETGTSMEIRKFKTSSDAVYWLNDGMIDIYYANISDSLWDAINPYTAVYNGTADETSTNGFIWGSGLQSGSQGIHFIWNPVTNGTYIDDDEEMDDQDFEYVGTINFTSDTTAQFIDGPNSINNPERLKILYNDSQRPNFNCTDCRVIWQFKINGTDTGDSEQLTDTIQMVIDVGDSSYTSTFFKSVRVGGDNTVAFKSVVDVFNVTNATNATGVQLRVYVGGSEGNYDYTEGGNIIEASGYLNETLTIEDAFRTRVSEIGVNNIMNTSSGSTNKMTLSFYQDYPTPNDNSQNNLQSVNDNATIKICTRDFGTTSDVPIENVEIKLYAMEWQMMGPPQQTWLTLYDPMDGSEVNNVTTGPTGCVAFKSFYPSGWPSCSCMDLQGTATRDSDVENIWAGRVCTPCQ